MIRRKSVSATVCGDDVVFLDNAKSEIRGIFVFSENLTVGHAMPWTWTIPATVIVTSFWPVRTGSVRQHGGGAAPESGYALVRVGMTSRLQFLGGPSKVLTEIAFTSPVHRITATGCRYGDTTSYVAVMCANRVEIYQSFRLVPLRGWDTTPGPAFTLSLLDRRTRPRSMSDGALCQSSQVVACAFPSAVAEQGLMVSRGTSLMQFTDVCVKHQPVVSEQYVVAVDREVRRVCVWCIETGDMLHEFHRGYGIAKLGSISMPTPEVILLSTDRATMHVWKLHERSSGLRNWRLPLLQLASTVYDAIAPVWSAVQIRTTHDRAHGGLLTVGTQCSEHSMVILSCDTQTGEYFLTSVDLRSGEQQLGPVSSV